MTTTPNQQIHFERPVPELVGAVHCAVTLHGVAQQSTAPVAPAAIQRIEDTHSLSAHTEHWSAVDGTTVHHGLEAAKPCPTHPLTQLVINRSPL